jgi:hypothetical protein
MIPSATFDRDVIAIRKSYCSFIASAPPNRALAGIKGYITNLPNPDAEQVIAARQGIRAMIKF